MCSSLPSVIKKNSSKKLKRSQSNGLLGCKSLSQLEVSFGKNV